MIRQYELVEKVKSYDPDVDEDIINRAYVFAMKAHGTQKRASGEAYFSHPVEVAYKLTQYRLDAASIVTALLHDTVEDTDVTYQLLREMGFTERVISGIRAMTKVPGETNDEYMVRIKANNDAIRCKLADLRHNSDIRRLKGVSEKDVKRVAKYHAMYMELKDLV